METYTLRREQGVIVPPGLALLSRPALLALAGGRAHKGHKARPEQPLRSQSSS